MAEIEIGVVKHFFDRVGVVAIEMTNDELNVGDTIRIKGHTTDVTVTVQSMQIEHQSVNNVKKGDSAGIKITDKVRTHAKVYRIIP